MTKKVMRTHLVRKSDTFITRVRVPPGTRLDYSFMISMTKGAGATDIWQSDDEYGRPFTKNVKFDGRIEIESGITVELAVTAEQRKAWLAGEAADLPLVTQEILSTTPGGGRRSGSCGASRSGKRSLKSARPRQRYSRTTGSCTPVWL